VRVAELPPAVRIREVGPRDGFQNESRTIPTAEKVALIDGLGRTGLRRIEVTSFVRPEAIPQLADAEAVLDAIERPAGVALSVLVPNRRGLDRALGRRERFDEVGVFLSASETHNRLNLNRSVAESLAEASAVLGRAVAAGLRGEAIVSVAFGGPYDGPVDPERVFALGRALRAAGADELSFADTTGMANPRQVGDFFAAARAALDPEVELTAHFHNTRGAGLANVLAALQAGVTSFESSVGELGGCPIPPGSTGNIATEDLVSMLEEMGIATGVDLPSLLACAGRAEAALGRRLGSHTLRAGPVNWG
jgi:hydroxymethylglutaryl-CoA lyase